MYLNKNIAYTILGLDVDTHATPDEIKGAFKRVALKVHPDKTAKQDTNAFMKAKLAYDYLKEYNDKPPNIHLNNLNYYELFQKLFEVFGNAIATAATNDLFKADVAREETIREESQSKKENKENKDKYTDACENKKETDVFYDAHEEPSTYDIRIKMEVSMKEVYTEFGKKMRIKYRNEIGGISIRNIIVSFVDYKSEYHYKGFGDWDPFSEHYGDLIVLLKISENDNYIINTCIDKHDLIRCFEISVSDYYFGFSKEFDHFGSTVQFDHVPYKDGSEKVISCIGLQNTHKRGDLYIIFKIEMNKIGTDIQHMNELRNYFPTLM